MKPEQIDPRNVVKAGYEALGPRYGEWTGTVDPPFRMHYLESALDSLEPNSLVVELGSGSGLPVAELISTRHRIACVDVSKVQLEILGHNVPGAWRVISDMTTVQFRPSSIDLVVAFYSIIHVPRDDHSAIYASIWEWLRQGGQFATCLGVNNDPGGVYEWIDDVPMYWSAFDEQTSLSLIRDAGFDIIRNEVLLNFEDGREVRFLWVLATKPG